MVAVIVHRLSRAALTQVNRTQLSTDLGLLLVGSFVNIRSVGRIRDAQLFAYREHRYNTLRQPLERADSPPFFVQACSLHKNSDFT